MLSEIFNEEGESILSFKKGDIIIRLKSAFIKNTKSNENLGVEVEVIEGVDNSFRDRPVEFIGIKNNVIYVRSLTESWVGAGFYVYKLLLEKYEDNWKIFEVPDGLTLKDCL